MSKNGKEIPVCYLGNEEAIKEQVKELNKLGFVPATKQAKIPAWQAKGFDSVTHYRSWLHFNGLVSEEIMYDHVYQNQFTGETVNIEDY